jgi:TonB family protein
VALSETFDLLDIAAGKFSPAEGDRFDSFRFVIADAPPADDDDVPEPTLAAAPFFIEFDEPARLDPDRIGLVWELPAPAARPMRWRSPMVSLAVHLLPLLTIIGWPSTPADLAAPIPIRVVFEEPPPPPPATPTPQPKAPEPQFKTGRLSSVDQGDVKPNEQGLTTSPDFAATGDPLPEPVETQTAAAATPPPPLPAVKPAPPKEKSAFQLPKPPGANVPQRAETPRPATHSARYAGPAATHDEYLAYLVTLTRQHMDLLPLSVIAGRRGETVISLVVHDNGVINQLAVLHSSGYPDIDQRIERMVAAIGRAPPLPQWFQGNAMELVFTLQFPDALYER